MDTTTLVIGKELYFPLPALEGSRLVKALDENGFNYVGAFWLYRSETDDWRLHIATPLIKEIGLKETYRQIQEILTRLTPPLDESVVIITAIDPGDPVVRALQKAYHVEAGQPPVSVRRSIFDGTIIEGALIYRI